MKMVDVEVEIIKEFDTISKKINKQIDEYFDFKEQLYHLFDLDNDATLDIEDDRSSFWKIKTEMGRLKFVRSKRENLIFKQIQTYPVAVASVGNYTLVLEGNTTFSFYFDKTKKINYHYKCRILSNSKEMEGETDDRYK